MKPEKELLEDRAILLAKQLDFNKQSHGRGMTSTENREWNKMQEEIENLSGEIKNSQMFKERLARKAEGKFVSDRASSNVVGEMAHAIATGKRETRDGITLANGGANISTDNVRDELVHQLTASNPLVKMGARMVPMGNYQVFSKTDANPRPQHWGENDQIDTDSAMVISGRPVEFKTVVTMVKVSKPYLLDSDGRGQRMIGEAIMGAMNEVIVNSVLHGSNADKEPNGLDNISGVLTIDGSGAAVTDYSLHLDATAALMAKNVQNDRIGYIQGTKSWRQTAGLVSTDGQPLMAPKAIGDLQNFHTTAVLENYGAGTNQTRLYFGDFSNLVIGLGGTFKMELAEKYADTLQTAFLVWMRYDVQVLRPDNFCIVENLSAA
jgi:HK97 family phage major capsid protein